MATLKELYTTLKSLRDMKFLVVPLIFLQKHILI